MINRKEDSDFYYLFFSDGRTKSLKIVNKQDMDQNMTFNYGDDITFITDNIDSFQRIVLKPDSFLYGSFKNFLNGDASVIILDDNSFVVPCGTPALEISINEEEIIIEILNHHLLMDGIVMVKNILPDLRSHIDRMGLDTKKRLSELFSDVREAFNQKQKIRKPS